MYISDPVSAVQSEEGKLSSQPSEDAESAPKGKDCTVFLFIDFRCVFCRVCNVFQSLSLQNILI